MNSVISSFTTLSKERLSMIFTQNKDLSKWRGATAVIFFCPSGQVNHSVQPFVVILSSLVQTLALCFVVQSGSFQSSNWSLKLKLCCWDCSTWTPLSWIWHEQHMRGQGSSGYRQSGLSYCPSVLYPPCRHAAGIDIVKSWLTWKEYFYNSSLEEDNHIFVFQFGVVISWISTRLGPSCSPQCPVLLHSLHMTSNVLDKVFNRPVLRE